MSRASSRFWPCLAAVLALSFSACAPRGSTIPSPSPTAQNPSGTSAIELPTATIQLPSIALSATSTPMELTTATPLLVMVTAAKGDLFIRRGPDMAFNPISVFRQGQSARASARDVLARWLRIDVPGTQGTPGWISIVSIYTDVDGDASSLPEVEPMDWPVLAFLRNCTFDQMVADPGGILIPPVESFPANDVRMNPGAYTIHDADVDGYPEVMKVNIREGSAVDIRVDGNGQKRKCPLP